MFISVILFLRQKYVYKHGKGWVSTTYEFQIFTRKSEKRPSLRVFRISLKINRTSPLQLTRTSFHNFLSPLGHECWLSLLDCLVFCRNELISILIHIVRSLVQMQLKNAYVICYEKVLFHKTCFNNVGNLKLVLNNGW